jgi:hypothetical protein
MSTLIETCAGMAGVTCRALLGPKAKPPTKYLGNKVPYAEETLALLGCDTFDRYVLVDPGLPGLVWSILVADGHEVLRLLRRDEAEHAETLWHRTKTQPLPGSPEEMVAAWLVLQAGNANSKPVGLRPDGSWRTAGYGKLSPSAVRKGFKDRFVMPRLIADVAAVVGALDGARVEVVVGRAEEALQGRDLTDAYVYMDPDYEDRTGYAHGFPREAVLRTARDACARGARRVGVAEAAPLDGALPGWSAHVLTRRHWSQSKFSNKQEYLTVSPR